MVDAPARQSVRVTTKALDGGEPIVIFYGVAEPVPLKAGAIIRAELGTAPEELVEVVGPLSEQAIAAFGLTPGKFSQL